MTYSIRWRMDMKRTEFIDLLEEYLGPTAATMHFSALEMRIM